MDSDEGKLFIGGIAWDTTEETLTDYFAKYGVVNQTVIMCDKTTGRPRGFGFVVFSDPSVLDAVLQDRHIIDGRTVEAKRALSRDEQTPRSGYNSVGRGSGGSGNYRTKKVFVGGLPSTLTEEEFRDYFAKYGYVTDVVIMFDQNTSRPRGFGFISFDSEDAVDRVVQNTFHELNNKLVEVKRALPKDANPGGGGGGGRSGGYQGYGSSGGNANPYDGNRYGQTQNTGSGYPYSGFPQPNYGYGGANSALPYGGYGLGGYGGANSAFGGLYNNSSNPNAFKNSWGSQVPSYGGNYGNSVPWNLPAGGGGGGGGGGGSAAVGQSPGGVYGYGNQGYGYGNYGGNEGPYGNSGGYGGRSGNASNNNSGGGGEEQHVAGGGYYDGNGSSGY